MEEWGQHLNPVEYSQFRGRPLFVGWRGTNMKKIWGCSFERKTDILSNV